MPRPPRRLGEQRGFFSARADVTAEDITVEDAFRHPSSPLDRSRGTGQQPASMRQDVRGMGRSGSDAPSDSMQKRKESKKRGKEPGIPDRRRLETRDASLCSACRTQGTKGRRLRFHLMVALRRRKQAQWRREPARAMRRDLGLLRRATAGRAASPAVSATASSASDRSREAGTAHAPPAGWRSAAAVTAPPDDFQRIAAGPRRAFEGRCATSVLQCAPPPMS